MAVSGVEGFAAKRLFLIDFLHSGKLLYLAFHRIATLMGRERAYFIEVCSGDWTFVAKTQGTRHLVAPNTRRHTFLLAHLKKDDIILHYLTNALTKEQKWKSAFVGESVIDSEMEAQGNKIRCCLRQVHLLKNPVKLKDLRKENELSPQLNEAIKRSMQFYLFEIGKDDYEKIIELSRKPQEKGNRGTIIYINTP